MQYPLFATLERKIGDQEEGEEQPDINASTVYEKHSLIVGDNIKNLGRPIPNEAHESTNQPKNQCPLANQPYLPQNAVVNVGTSVIWFKGDVDHDHTITLSGESANAGFESGDFTYDTASKPITFNDTGTFDYFDTDVKYDDPSFVMNGAINVVNQVNPLINTTESDVGQFRYCRNVYGSC